jgi:hypothetical protein
MPSSKESKDVPAVADTNHYSIHNDRRNWLVSGLIIVLILLLIGAIAHNHQDSRGFGRKAGAFGAVGMRREGKLMGGGGKFNSTIGSNQNRIQGVVTAINGSTITVAGHGATNDVETNSSTQYQNGSSVKVNDSVVAFGTISGGKFTATQVVVNP